MDPHSGTRRLRLDLCRYGRNQLDPTAARSLGSRPLPTNRAAARDALPLAPERDHNTERLYNSLLVITPDGRLLASHRKINTLKVGPESWSSAGDQAKPIVVAPFGPVGLLICADAFSPSIAQQLKALGARLLVSSAAWAPGLHGLNGEWE